MNKIVLTCAAAVIAFSANAQQLGTSGLAVIGTTASEQITNGGLAGKTTGLTDTLYFANQNQTTTSTFVPSLYDTQLPMDSGRVFGHSSFGYKAFAQLYRFSSIERTAPVDTTYHILGVFAAFHGTATSTTKNVTFNIWKRDANKYIVTGRPKFAIYGAPLATAAISRNVTFNAIQKLTLAPYYFSSPLTGVNYDIYAGYSLPSYTYGSLGGDSLGLFTTPNTNGGTLQSVDASGDTLVNVNVLMMNSSNQWKSAGFDPAIAKPGDLILFPIIKLSCPTCTGGNVSVAGFTQNDLKFFGNSPNPAVNYTNIKFALKSNADVTIYVSDITGKTIQTVKQNNLAIGEHSIRIETGNLAAGTYSYLLVTSKGDGIGSQMTIAK